MKSKACPFAVVVCNNLLNLVYVSKGVSTK
jgi:hypothetical protein